MWRVMSISAQSRGQSWRVVNSAWVDFILKSSDGLPLMVFWLLLLPTEFDFGYFCLFFCPFEDHQTFVQEFVQ